MFHKKKAAAGKSLPARHPTRSLTETVQHPKIHSDQWFIDDEQTLMRDSVTDLWESDVATLAQFGEIGTDILPHWRFTNHSTGETFAMKITQSLPPSKVFPKGGPIRILSEFTGHRQVRVDNERMYISNDPDEKWDMTPEGLRLRWAGKMWEGTFNEERTVWTSFSGFLQRDKTDPNIWHETLSSGDRHTLIELSRTAGYVILFDQSRNLTLRICELQMAFYSPTNDTFEVIKTGHYTDDGVKDSIMRELTKYCPSVWSPSQVALFFTALGMSALTTRIIRMGIDGPTLLTLDDADLRDELKIRSSILRKKVLASMCLHSKHEVRKQAPLEKIVSHSSRIAANQSSVLKLREEMRGKPATETPRVRRESTTDDSDPEQGIVPAITEKRRGTVFLSYTWKNQSLVAAVHHRLQELGYRTWMDIQQMSVGDNLLEQIDKGIRASDLVCTFISSAYAASENCRKEVLLADNLKKPMLCILVEKPHQIPWPPSGPMGPVFAGALYIEYPDTDAVEDVVTAIKLRVD